MGIKSKRVAFHFDESKLKTFDPKLTPEERLKQIRESEPPLRCPVCGSYNSPKLHRR